MVDRERVAIVTGASRGIGRAVTERLGHDGVAVVVNYHHNREAAKEVVEAVTAAGGRAVNVAAGLPDSVTAVLGVYGAPKASVEVLTRSLAHQLGPRGITVNAVAPGPTDTDMLAPAARANLDATIAQTPLRRLGQPADVAGVVAFPAGEEARWITGQTIHANGEFE